MILLSDSLTFPHLFSDMDDDDFEHDCFALRDLGYIDGIRADGTIIDIYLTDKTLVYFENKFKNNLKSVIDWLLKFKP